MSTIFFYLNLSKIVQLKIYNFLLLHHIFCLTPFARYAMKSLSVLLVQHVTTTTGWRCPNSKASGLDIRALKEFGMKFTDVVEWFERSN